MRSVVFLAIAALGMAGCAGGGAQFACASADWRALGLADGAAGLDDDAFDKRKDPCDSADVDADAYDAGRLEGLVSYCTPASGFLAGAADEEYENVCEDAAEEAFLAEYEIGQTYFKAMEARDAAYRAASEARSSLARHETGIRSAKSRYENSYLSGDERYAARLDLEYHQREIEGLKIKIPKLNVRKAQTEAALKELKASLVASGRLPKPAAN